MLFLAITRVLLGSRLLFLAITLGLGVAGASGVQQAKADAQRGGYELKSFTVDGGAGVSRSAGGGYELSVTIGQPDAGSQRGAGHELDGGFWEVPAAIAVAAVSLLSCLGLAAMLGTSGASGLRRRLRPRRLGLAAVVLAAASSLAGQAAAQEPLGNSFTVQGRLLLDGDPVNDALSMTFKLYDSPAGLAPLAMQELSAVQVTDGVFNALLDFGAGAFDGNARWLGITIDSEAELTPRQPLTAAPYAHHARSAGNAVLLEGLSPNQFLRRDMPGSITGTLSIGPEENALPVTVGKEELRIIRGTVSSAGFILQGTGFTTSRQGLGSFTVTFGNQFSSVPTVTATLFNSSGTIAISSPFAGGFMVETRDLIGDAADNHFCFIAIGPR